MLRMLMVSLCSGISPERRDNRKTNSEQGVPLKMESFYRKQNLFS